jgi:hypothetical protein
MCIAQYLVAINNGMQAITLDIDLWKYIHIYIKSVHGRLMLLQIPSQRVDSNILNLQRRLHVSV